jgi:hypothetical protein
MMHRVCLLVPPDYRLPHGYHMSNNGYSVTQLLERQSSTHASRKVGRDVPFAMEQPDHGTSSPKWLHLF